MVVLLLSDNSVRVGACSEAAREFFVALLSYIPPKKQEDFHVASILLPVAVPTLLSFPCNFTVGLLYC
jgi:hypothetical protein